MQLVAMEAKIDAGQQLFSRRVRTSYTTFRYRIEYGGQHGISFGP